MIRTGGDKLVLKGLKFYGYHGAIPEENTLGQMFIVDIDAWVSLKKAGLSDNLDDTISYVDIFRLALLSIPLRLYKTSRIQTIWWFMSNYIICSIAKEIVEGPPLNLLEAVAERIASRTLEKFPQVTAVQVKLCKPNVALIKNTIDYLGVEIFRQQKHFWFKEPVNVPPNFVFN